MKSMKLHLTAPLLAGIGLAAAHAAENAPPNILMITTDDVGYYNIGAYNLGMMGVPTPNIDRLAR